MKKLPGLLLLCLWGVSCATEPASSNGSLSDEPVKGQGDEQIITEVIPEVREEEIQEEQWEAVELKEPLTIEIINIGPSWDMDYPPFPVINLIPEEVNLSGAFLVQIEVRVNNTKFGDDPRSFIFRPDGTCLQKVEQMSMSQGRIRFTSKMEFKGTYQYDPSRYRLEMLFTESRAPGDVWYRSGGHSVVDYFVINQEGLYDVYFSRDPQRWEKSRTEIPADEEEESRFFLQGLSLTDENFTFFRESRLGSRSAEVPDYQSARRYDLRGRAMDEKGLVFYLEDSLLFKNDYVYLYEIPGGVVYRERLGE